MPDLPLPPLTAAANYAQVERIREASLFHVIKNENPKLAAPLKASMALLLLRQTIVHA